MNILFFLTPKSEVAYIYNDGTLRQTLEKMEYYRYTAIPILNHAGQYIGTLTEGDLLRIIKKQYSLNLHDAEDFPIEEIPRRWKYAPVNAGCTIEELVDTSMQQNFVPVVDDQNVFIGIIRRKQIIEHLYKKNQRTQDLKITVPLPNAAAAMKEGTPV